MDSKTIGFILRTQVYVSAFLAIVIVLSAVFMGAWGIFKGDYTGKYIPQLISDWGGVIIGFYFGTAYSQVAKLMEPNRLQDGAEASKTKTES